MPRNIFETAYRTYRKPQHKMIEARFWEPGLDGGVQCGLCPHRCRIAPGRNGICGVRRNEDGRLLSLVYGRVAAAHTDPIEKKPLFHFMPGSAIFSYAAVGCNLSCRHCQNADISQMPRDAKRIVGHQTSAEDLVETAVAGGSISIAATYTEPTVFLEYAYDVAAAARERGLKNVFVTNGYIEAEPLRAVAPFLDAANIDLKGFTEEFYRSVCGARLQPVLDAIALYRSLGVWIEITTLIIPGLNDREEELRRIARFIRDLGREVPWHVSRFHPDYRLTDRAATPPDVIHRAREIGREEGLLYVYEGNVAGGEENTFCHRCGRVVITRSGFTVLGRHLEDGVCAFCGAFCHGVWS